MKRAPVIAAVVAVLISCATTFGADTIELPFEYFAGRWVNGQYLHGTYYLQKDHYPQYSWSYLLTSDPFRFGIDRFQTNLLYRYENDEFLSAPLSLDYRPFDHWQLGVHGLEYRYINRNNESDVTNPDYNSYQSKQLTFNVTSYWQRHTDIAVTDKAAPYAYRVQPILTKGNVTISNDWSFDLREYRSTVNDVDYYLRVYDWMLPYEGTIDSVYTWLYWYRDTARSTAVWKLENAILWSASDNTILGGRLVYNGVYSERLGYWSFFRSWDPNWGVAINDHGFRREVGTGVSHYFRPELSFATCALAPLFVTGRAYQDYTYRKGDDARSRGDFPGVTDNWRLVKRHKLTRDNSGFSLSLDFIDRGEFDNNVVIDDYSGFYRNMLFHGQNHISLSCSYDYRHNSSYPKGVTLDFMVARGIRNRAEIGTTVSYSWAQWRSHSETAEFKVFFRARSYTYDSNYGHGWYRDTPSDVLYGPELSAGQTYISFTLRPYRVYTDVPNRSRFLAFDFDYRSYTDWLNTVLCAGLGRTMTVELQSTLYWTFENITSTILRSHHYSVSLESRLLRRLLIKAGLSQSFYTGQATGSGFSDPRFEINLHGLL